VKIAGFSIQKIKNVSALKAELSTLLGVATKEVKIHAKTLSRTEGCDEGNRILVVEL